MKAKAIDEMNRQKQFWKGWAVLNEKTQNIIPITNKRNAEFTLSLLARGHKLIKIEIREARK